MGPNAAAQRATVSRKLWLGLAAGIVIFSWLISNRSAKNESDVVPASRSAAAELPSSIPGTLPPQSTPSAQTGTTARIRYAVELVTPVRLGPSARAPQTGELYRQEEVEVYEVENGWARVTKFYHGGVEGLDGQVARWVPLKALSEKRPDDLPQPALGDDPRIGGLPKVGEDGLSTKDVLILHAAAQYFLQTGEATRIEFGNKSTTKPGVYYLNFGHHPNRFFKPGDIPGLEGRIGKFQNL